MRFDVNIFKAEDWLFYAQYLSRSKKEIIIDKPLYHYFQRNGSIINTYYEETEIGIRKGRYILQQFETILEKANIPKVLYYKQLSQRYFQSILRYSINIWDFRNQRTFSEKFKKLNVYVENYMPYSKIDRNNLTFWQKIMLKAKSAMLLSFYGIAFNAAKNIKQKIIAFRKI